MGRPRRTGMRHWSPIRSDGSAPQSARLLGEVDQEVALAALVDERAFDDLRVARDVVVAARDHRDDLLARLNGAIRAMQADGTIATLESRWF